MTPTPRAILLVGLGLPVALLPALVHPGLWPVWFACLALTLLALGIDGLRAPRPSRLRSRLELGGPYYVGRPGALTLHIHAPGAEPFTLRARLELEGPVPAALERTVRAQGESTLELELRPTRRGTVKLVELWLEWTGPWGLMRARDRRPLDQGAEVLPDLHFIRDSAVRFASSAELMAGMHVKRHLGAGSEFDSVREFVPGMDHRAIHWKASARHRRLLVREFRAERNHQVMLAVDCGHLMAEPLGEIPRLDHAVNAGLLLAYVGLRYGDRVGLYGFDARPRVYVAPRSGVGSFARLQASTARLGYHDEETNFALGLAELSLRLRERALVVVLTDFVDTITAELMMENLERTAQRHLVLFVALRDPTLDGLERRVPNALGDMARSVVASDLRRERERVLLRLQRRGVLTLDVPPEGLSGGLINRYLEIKQREMIA